MSVCSNKNSLPRDPLPLKPMMTSDNIGVKLPAASRAEDEREGEKEDLEGASQMQGTSSRHNAMHIITTYLCDREAATESTSRPNGPDHTRRHHGRRKWNE